MSQPATIKRTCDCGATFYAKPCDLKRGRGITCSTTCAARRGARAAHQKHQQGGAANFNYRGGRSSRPYESYVRRYRHCNPRKHAAHVAVFQAIRKGLLVRPDCCDSCLKMCKPDAHHPNYSKPLSVEWLCKKCHRAADEIRIRAIRESLQRIAEQAAV